VWSEEQSNPKSTENFSYRYTFLTEVRSERKLLVSTNQSSKSALMDCVGRLDTRIAIVSCIVTPRSRNHDVLLGPAKCEISESVNMSTRPQCELKGIWDDLDVFYQVPDVRAPFDGYLGSLTFPMEDLQDVPQKHFLLADRKGVVVDIMCGSVKSKKAPMTSGM